MGWASEEKGRGPSPTVLSLCPGWEPSPSLESLLSPSNFRPSPFLQPFLRKAQSWKRSPSEERIYERSQPGPGSFLDPPWLWHHQSLRRIPDSYQPASCTMSSTPMHSPTSANSLLPGTPTWWWGGGDPKSGGTELHSLKILPTHIQAPPAPCFPPLPEPRPSLPMWS